MTKRETSGEEEQSANENEQYKKLPFWWRTQTVDSCHFSVRHEERPQKRCQEELLQAHERPFNSFKGRT